MAPSVAPGSQMRSMGSAVRRKGGGDFGDMQAHQAGLDHHFTGEFHARGAEIHALHALLSEGAHATVKIAAGGAEEEPADPGKQRIAKVTMQKGHGMVADATMKPIAHNQVGAGSQLFQKSRKVADVIAAVAVGHENVVAARRANSTTQGASVSLFRHFDDASPFGAGNLLGAVRGAVVCDDHLAVDPVFFERSQGLADAGGYRIALVQAGKNDGDLRFILGRLDEVADSFLGVLEAVAHETMARGSGETPPSSC